MTPADKPEILAAAEAEQRNWDPDELITFSIGRLELQCLIAGIQLATRHPHWNGPSRHVAETIIRTMAKHAYKDFPATMAICEKGWDVRYDDRPERSPRKEVPLHFVIKP